MSPELSQKLSQAEQLLQEGRPQDALPFIAELMRAEPKSPRVWWARATAALMMGDSAEAEMALKRTADLDAAAPFASASLGDLLSELGRTAEAEAAWREALRRDPGFTPAALSLAEDLLERGLAEEAIKALPALSAQRPDPNVLLLRGRAHASLGAEREALSDLRACVEVSGGAPVALHALASALLSIGHMAEAEAAARRALTGQPGSPDLLQILGHALQGQDRLEEAQAAFSDAIASQPLHPGAHRDYSQIVWMRTGDLAAAVEKLDQALELAPGHPALTVVKGKLLEFGGDAEGARALLRDAADGASAPPYLLCAASQVVLEADAGAAVKYAERAVERSPADAYGRSILLQAQLAAGDLEGADASLARLRALAPGDQHGLAYEATLKRLRGEDHCGLYDYDALVRTFVIETPEGWPDLGAYLADLKAALEAIHVNAAHPVGQSLRGGAQTNVRLERSQDPAIKAFFQAIRPAVDAYIAGLDESHPAMTDRRAADWRVAGAWSVRLRSGGRHVDHLHDHGWISSAFYVDLPPAVSGEGNQGSLRFGKPGTVTAPELGAEHWIKPQAGMLALFPSYMWHGTEPFTDERPRLTIAFDVVPA